MVPEIEILEQLLDEAWPVDRAVAFLDTLGVSGWRVLQRHWQEGNVELRDGEGLLPAWRAEALFRERRGDAEVQVETSRTGSRLI
ncbi:MAG: hypothetical protein EP330_14065 [Deltaproteobacteria bacterium]|nr:MAG: hypothetical protein EP330_14065 [Deltaproteobacteria bacterium]